jgi:hypothetical protein
LQVLPYFALAWSLSHSPNLVARHLVFRTGLEAGMGFLITGTDISGRIILRRESVEAAQKKAAELAQAGCHDIAIIAPDGHRYTADAFDQLPVDS